MMNMIEDDGRPTPDFEHMVETTVKSWLAHDKLLGNKTDFIVMAVQERDGRKSFWGLIDVPNTPEEDLYVEMERRFYCAVRTLGEKQVFGLGILDIRAVLARSELPDPPTY